MTITISIQCCKLITGTSVLQIIADNADYTGMSSEEIYAEIWQRYNTAFDGNMPAIYSYLVGGWEWQVIGNQYASEFSNIVYLAEAFGVLLYIQYIKNKRRQPPRG